jgi:hypothetical protein
LFPESTGGVQNNKIEGGRDVLSEETSLRRSSKASSANQKLEFSFSQKIGWFSRKKKKSGWTGKL